MSTGDGSDTAFEIDICEGHYPNIANVSLHSAKNDQGVKDDNSKRHIADEDLSLDFHTYAIDWNEDEIVYYMDGVEIDRKKSYTAQRPVFPKLSTAVMTWAGPVTDNLDGKSMDVDYVRVYKKK